MQRQEAARQKMYPMDYQLKTNAEGVNICRFWNYGVCLKGEQCRHDHTHCHKCGEAGHRGMNCACDGSIEDL